MSSTTHNLPFVRFTKQASTPPMALTSTLVAAADAYALLQLAPWVEQPSPQSTFPARAAMLEDGTAHPGFDAYKYCGDANGGDGKQIAYAGAVAYRFRVPAAALTGPTDITSIALPLYVDRWLVDGVHVAAYLSDDPSPPADWATIRAGDKSAADLLPMTYTDPGGERIVVEKNGTTTLTWNASTDSKQYVYVMLTLEDYATVRGFWIEGAGLLSGNQAVTTFAAAVAPDTVDALYLGEYSVLPPVHADLSATLTAYTSTTIKGKTPTEARADREYIETAFAQIDNLTAAKNTTGWAPGVRFEASGADTYIRIARRITASWYRPTDARVVTRLRFRDATSSGGVLVGRVLVYFVPGYLIPDDGDTRVGYAADDYSVAGDSESRRALWTGKATAVSFWTGSVASVLPAVCLLDILTNQSITADTLFDVSYAVAREGTVIVATTPHRVSGVITSDVSLSATLNCVELI
jgi:hypothetical protein